MSQPLRFGICTDQKLPWLTLVRRWKLLEHLGFDGVWDCVVAIGGLGIVAALALQFSVRHV